MRTRTIHNAVTGETSIIEVDDAWILAHYSNQVVISLANTSYALNTSDTISIQLYTPDLADWSKDALTDNLAITMQFGESIQEINLVNGAWSDTIEFDNVGTYRITCLSLPSNEIEVVVS